MPDFELPAWLGLILFVALMIAGAWVGDVLQAGANVPPAIGDEAFLVEGGSGWPFYFEGGD